MSSDGRKRNVDVKDGDQDCCKRACTGDCASGQMLDPGRPEGGGDHDKTATIVSADDGITHRSPAANVQAAVKGKVLNQRQGHTCVAYSFALAMTQGLQSKYDIGCDPALFVEKVKALCPCWEGHQTELMPKEWNDVHDSNGAFIEDVDHQLRYHVKVESRKIDSFDEAYREMDRAKALEMFLPCTIITNDKNHSQHSVALKATVPGGTMQAQNSWGSQQVHMTVTRENFLCAITFDPIITAAKKSGSSINQAFSISDTYRKRLKKRGEQEAALAANEVKFKALEGKVKDQDDMIQTLIHENRILLQSKDEAAANEAKYKTVQNQVIEQTNMIRTLIKTNGELLLSEEAAAANEEKYKDLESKVKALTDTIKNLEDDKRNSRRKIGEHYKGKCGCGFECDNICDGVCCKCAEDDPDTNCDACNRRDAGPISRGDGDEIEEDSDVDEEDCDDDEEDMESEDEGEEWEEARHGYFR